MSTNPYAPPASQTLEASSDRNDPKILKVKSGQKMILWAIVLNFAAFGVAMVALGGVFLAIVVNLVALVISIWGLIRLCSGLGFSVLSIILLVILMIVPLVNLITLLILNSKATNALRAAGYSVGLMGAKG
jgi:hypothetical protein